EVAGGDSAHCVHEQLEPLGFAVELGEHGRAGMLDLVLRLAGAKAIGKAAPERIEPGVGHLEKAAHELRALAIEEQRRLCRIAILRSGTVAVALEKPQRDERVEEVGIGAGMQAE